MNHINSSFDKRFNRAKTGIQAYFILIGLVLVLGTIAGIFFLCKGVDVIQERGLKSLVSEVWDGPSTNTIVGDTE